jgi:competence protein ComEA
MKRMMVPWGLVLMSGTILWGILFLRIGTGAEPTQILAQPDSLLRDTLKHSPDTISSPARSDTIAQTPGPPASGSPECINVNTAGTEQLESLPGIGPVIAARITSYRRQHGPFRSPEQLIEVKGIGEVRLRKIRLHICF